MNDVNVDAKWPDVSDIYQVHLHRSAFMDHMKFTFVEIRIEFTPPLGKGQPEKGES